MTTRWRIYCITEGGWQYTTSSTTPTVCPNDGGHSVNASSASAMNTIIPSDGPVIIESNYAFYQRANSIKSQDTTTSLSDADATLTSNQLFSKLLVITPTATRTITFPNASDIVSGLVGIEVGDSIDVNFVNTSTTHKVIVDMGTGGTSIGNLNILSRSSGGFRIRITNVTSSTEAYEVYRLDTGISEQATGFFDNYELTTINSSSYTIDPSDQILIITSSISSTLTLPKISTLNTTNNKKKYIITKLNDVKSAKISIEPASGDKIAGDDSFKISNNYNSISLYSDGVDTWLIF